MTATSPFPARCNSDLRSLPPHPSKTISEAVASRHDVIDLTVGLPAYGTPPALREALGRRVLGAAVGRDPIDVYAPSRGVARTRAAIVALYRRWYGLDVDSDEVLVTHGAAQALWLAVFALTSAGDDVLIPDPAYPIYAGSVASLGRRPVWVPHPGKGFGVDPNAMVDALTDRTSMLILNSPANPTGATVAPLDMEALLSAVRDRGVTVVHDEALGFFAVDVPHLPARGCASGAGAVLVNSLSKPMGATGWRLGWAIGPRAVIDLMSKAHTYMTLAVNTALQEAVADVLDTDEMAKIFRRRAAQTALRRGALASALAANPWFDMPEENSGAGLYLFPSVAPLAARLGRAQDPGLAVATHLLDRCGVAVVPGSAFGPSSRDHIRLSAAASETVLAEAAQRMEGA